MNIFRLQTIKFRVFKYLSDTAAPVLGYFMSVFLLFNCTVFKSTYVIILELI